MIIEEFSSFLQIHRIVNFYNRDEFFIDFEKLFYKPLQNLTWDK